MEFRTIGEGSGFCLGQEDFNSSPSPKISSEDIENAIKFCANENNKKFIFEKITRATMVMGIPFAVLRKEETGLSHKLKYFHSKKIYLKYEHDFAIGEHRKASKVVEIVSGHHFVETLGILDESTHLQSYRCKTNCRGIVKKLPPSLLSKDKVLATQELVRNKLKDVPEVLQEESSFIYTKTFALGSFQCKITKIIIYSILQTDIVQPLAFKNNKEEAARAVVRAVANLHRSNYCHNDPKGANFLWRVINGQIKIRIIDFDTTKKIDQPLYPQGTRLYFSPEFADYEDAYDRDQRTFNPQLNVAKESWALGVVIADDIYGLKLPWTQVERWSDFKRLINCINPDLSPMPPKIRQVVEGLLSRNPVQRFSAIQADEILSNN